MNELKHYLYRDKGYILFNSIFENEELFWLSFLSGGHVDWTYYIPITKDEFFSIWHKKITLESIYKKYSHIRMYASESHKLEQQYGLLEIIETHNLPSAIKQMFFKSEIPI